MDETIKGPTTWVDGFDIVEHPLHPEYAKLIKISLSRVKSSDSGKSVVMLELDNSMQAAALVRGLRDLADSIERVE